jgi:hypothetical protein
MQYVNMNEVAYDATDIIFPGLGNCHGVVYQTNVGLFALHIYGNPDNTPNKAPFFGSFVKGHRLGATAVGRRLYGLCPSNRYGGVNGAQKAELQVCAAALGFAGEIRGAMWDTAQRGWRTTYVECNLVGAAVQVQIENFTTGTSATGGNPSSFDHKTITVTQPPGFGFQPMVYGSLKGSDTVITGVTRMPGTPSIVIAPAVL